MFVLSPFYLIIKGRAFNKERGNINELKTDLPQLPSVLTLFLKTSEIILHEQRTLLCLQSFLHKSSVSRPREHLRLTVRKQLDSPFPWMYFLCRHDARGFSAE